jgi:hypothetical protein
LLIFAVMDTTSALHPARLDVTGAEDETAKGVPPPSSAPMAAGVLSGMAAGAAVGAMAGPPGILAGAVIGSAVGAAASIALDVQNVEDEQNDEQLDRDIGVFGGHLGEASPNQPPAVRGAFSAASMGVSTGPAIEPSEGPIPSVEEK